MDLSPTVSSEPSPGRFIVKTLGCKANAYDGQLIEEALRQEGLQAAREGDSVQLCIVNSCTVTDEADRQSRKLATRLARDYPGAKIVLTGCGAEVNPELYAATAGVDYVVGNSDKARLAMLVSEATQGALPAHSVLGRVAGYDEMISRHPMDREWPLPRESFFAATPADAGRTRAFLKIQEGCNSFCTFCVIPYGRGPARSLEIKEIVSQVTALVDSGVQEVVISGTNLGDYGMDWPDGRPELERLFRAIFGETRLLRLRVGSLDPTEITPGLRQLMKDEPRFCPHFHVSLQSPHSRVLKLMKRKYGFAEVEACLQSLAKMRAPVGGVFVGVDLITGFPGESVADFEWTVEALRKLPWTRLHVFPYSERQGTPATRLPGIVPMGERNRRAKILRELSLERLRAAYQEILVNCLQQGTELSEVLVEGDCKGPNPQQRWTPGYTPNYIRILIPSSKELPELSLRNQRLRVRPTELYVDRSAGDVCFIGQWV